MIWRYSEFEKSIIVFIDFKNNAAIENTYVCKKKRHEKPAIFFLLFIKIIFTFFFFFFFFLVPFPPVAWIWLRVWNMLRHRESDNKNNIKHCFLTFNWRWSLHLLTSSCYQLIFVNNNNKIIHRAIVNDQNWLLLTIHKCQIG